MICGEPAKLVVGMGRGGGGCRNALTCFMLHILGLNGSTSDAPESVNWLVT